MMDINVEGFEGAISHVIRLVGTCIEFFGVFIIVAGIVWSTYHATRRRVDEGLYDRYKIHIGRSLLLGLEVLVAADIAKTIAIEVTFTSLGLLAGLVVVRTFLSWTLVLEIEGRWPWQRQLLPMRVGPSTSRTDRGAMTAGSHFNDPIESMTLGNMRANGVPSLAMSGSPNGCTETSL
jgi:uncharacterized membrane protein